MGQGIFNYNINYLIWEMLIYFTKVFSRCSLEQNKNAVTLTHSAQRKHSFLGKMSKKKKFPSKNNIFFELLHHILGHRSTRSLLYGGNDNVWEDIELSIYPYSFCTLGQISSMNKNARSKNLLKPKSHFKWVFMDIIPSTPPKRLTSETTFF